MGRLSFPDLVGKGADRILPMVLTQISGDAMAALVMAAGLAALMSTMDSQLLTLSSIFTRDIAPLAGAKKQNDSITGRIFVIFLSLAGLALAWNPPATILQIATQTFTGLAVLFPTVIFGLYFKRAYPPAAILSILCGEGLLLLFYFRKLSAGPFLPVIWIMTATFAVYLLVHAYMSAAEGRLQLGTPDWIRSPFLYFLAGIFLLAMDFWAWGKSGPTVAGIPAWMFYFIFLSGLQTAVMVVWVRRDSARG
jgi:SSS family solute:Na+ symporter